MNQGQSSGIMKAVGIFMIVLALVNVVPGLVFIGSGAPQEIAEDDTLVEGSAAAETAETFGSFTTPMGLMTLIHAPVLAAVGIALLLGKRWEIFAAVMILLDLLVKVGLTLSQLAIGRTGSIIVPIIIIVIDLVAIYISWQQWSARKVAPAVAPDERIERPQYR